MNKRKKKVQFWIGFILYQVFLEADPQDFDWNMHVKPTKNLKTWFLDEMCEELELRNSI